MVREVQSGKVLVVGWLARVNHQTLKALLAPVAALGLPISGTVSDKQESVRKALEETWPEVPHQWCQSHYLGNVTRPIYDQDRALKAELRKAIREKVRESLKEVLSGSKDSGFSPSAGRGDVGRRDPR